MNQGPYNNFQGFLEEFRKNPNYHDDMIEREENAPVARTMIDTVEKIHNFSGKDVELFLFLLHSGLVERQGPKIKNDISKFKIYLEKALDIVSDPTEKAFGKASKLMDFEDADANGAGKNIKSEVFHILDHVRFPVLNNNSEFGFKYFHFIESDFQGSEGEKYLRCIKLAEEIRKKFGVSTCRELDCLFNYVYHREKRMRNPEKYDEDEKKILRKKCMEKGKLLKLKAETVEIFGIEYLPVKIMPERVKNAISEVLVAYEKSPTRAFGSLVKAYGAVGEVTQDKDFEVHKRKVVEVARNNTMFLGDGLTYEQKKNLVDLINIFLKDVRQLVIPD